MISVSVIVNNYNYGSYIRQAIDSSLTQTYPDVQVIVVDDGSSDNSVSIINSYGDRIIPVLKSNGGQASAMNAGFQSSRGDLVIFLDADDYLFPQAVESIVAAWKTGASHVQARLELVDVSGQYIDLCPPPEIIFDRGDVKPILLKKGRYNSTVTSGNCFSRSVLEKILPIPESDFRISADGYLVNIAPFYGNVIALETVIGARRKHGNNLWASFESGLRVEQFRKSMNHDSLKHKYIMSKAEELGHQCSSNLGFHDYLHIQDRLVSIRLDSYTHPIEGDSRFILGIRGFWAVWKYTKFKWARKTILSIWFLCIASLPKPLAIAAINWKFAGKTRPKWIDGVLKRIRFSTQ